MRQVPTLKLAIAQAKQIPRSHPRRLHAQTLLAQWVKEVQWMEDRPIFRQAQQLAKTGKIEQLRSAVALVQLIRPNAPSIQRRRLRCGGGWLKFR
ncbi:MAG: hypothetical protein HC936_12935 [Leptolyngbyaceae cyanobacterium SU_3_3]|nr:hypothetical protein [Leptolyngbyaceae cyanobacterium SU_3_3]